MSRPEDLFGDASLDLQPFEVPLDGGAFFLIVEFAPLPPARRLKPQSPNEVLVKQAVAGRREFMRRVLADIALPEVHLVSRTSRESMVNRVALEREGNAQIGEPLEFLKALLGSEAADRAGYSQHVLMFETLYLKPVVSHLTYKTLLSDVVFEHVSRTRTELERYREAQERAWAPSLKQPERFDDEHLGRFMRYALSYQFIPVRILDVLREPNLARLIFGTAPYERVVRGARSPRNPAANAARLEEDEDEASLNGPYEDEL